MTLDHRQRGFYRQIERGVLALFANLAAIAIQKANLLHSMQERVGDLEFVDEVVRIISGKVETPGVLYTIVQQIGIRFSCSQCTLFLVHQGDEGPVLKPEVAYPPETSAKDIFSFKPGQGLAGWVYSKGESVCLADAREDDRFITIREKTKGTPRAMLLVPVKSGGRVVGVISADQNKAGSFNDNHKRLLNALASHVAIALQRAQQLEELDETRRRYNQDKSH